MMRGYRKYEEHTLSMKEELMKSVNFVERELVKLGRTGKEE